MSTTADQVVSTKARTPGAKGSWRRIVSASSSSGANAGRRRTRLVVSSATRPAARTTNSLAATGTETVIGANTNPANATNSTVALAAKTRQNNGSEETRWRTLRSFAQSRPMGRRAWTNCRLSSAARDRNLYAPTSGHERVGRRTRTRARTISPACDECRSHSRVGSLGSTSPARPDGAAGSSRRWTGCVG